jgi:hypothetical protein
LSVARAAETLPALFASGPRHSDWRSCPPRHPWQAGAQSLAPSSFRVSGRPVRNVPLITASSPRLAIRRLLIPHLRAANSQQRILAAGMASSPRNLSFILCGLRATPSRISTKSRLRMAAHNRATVAICVAFTITNVAEPKFLHASKTGSAYLSISKGAWESNSRTGRQFFRWVHAFSCRGLGARISNLTDLGETK